MGKTYWLFNTDETEDEGEGAYRKMIAQSCIAAWGSCRNQGAKKTLERPQSGETVFLFCAGRGIIASGQVTEKQPIVGNSVFGGEADGEFHRHIENVKELGQPLTVSEIFNKTKYHLPYRHILCELKSPLAVQFIVNHIDAESTIAAEDRDLSDKQLDQAIRNNRLRFRDEVVAFDKKVMARRRHGQDRLRLLALDVYGNQCALCDISDPALLEASHIVRWTDDPSARADLANIICLCKFHHALFECGYFGLTDTLQVVKKPGRKGNMLASILDLTSEFRIQDESYFPKAKYLRKHRKRCNL
jgi:hypothetical protein